VIAPSGRTLASLRPAVQKVRERGCELIAISDDPEFVTEADTAFPLVPETSEWLSPLLTVVPGQVAAVALATLRGADVDSPAGLTKITLTR
jgi:glucosamine--fructose-6-phosphate aminotransferase (isomerizing)